MESRIGAMTIILLVILSMAGGLRAESPPTYAETQATETGPPPTFVWVGGGDDGHLIPSPPPFHLLDIEDPMPNPTEGADGGWFGNKDGNGIYHNAVTGETIEVPFESHSTPIPMMGEGYDGIFPIFEEEPLVETFSSMSRITNTDASPWRMNVKLLGRFEDTSGGDHWYVCSGSMKDAEVVLTAGHCVFSRDPDIMDWAEEIWIYPGWDGIGSYSNPPVEPFGYGYATHFASWTGWTSSGNWDNDWGLISTTRAMGMMTGWYGYAWGGDCAYHMGEYYNNASYPAQSCPDPGLHNGHDMYYWSGYPDSCPNNQLQLDTGGGNCFDTVWGGMSGSGMYRISGSSRYVHAICSTSDRNLWGRYARQTEPWCDYMQTNFIAGSRGTSFDLQALDTNFEPTTITAGQTTTLANFLTTNPTTGTDGGTWNFDAYLSTNDNISTADTHLGAMVYTWTYSTMSSVRVNLIQRTIPTNTPSGTYWIGVILDASTDGDSSNNDTDRWDATELTVIGVADLEADYIYAPTGVYASDVAFPVSYHATNIGGDPSDPITVEVRASTNQTITAADTLLANFSHSGLPGGGTLSNVPNVSFPASLPNGYYYIGMIVHAADDVNGSNDTDYDIVRLMKFDGLFFDGFESGDVSGWSSLAP